MSNSLEEARRARRAQLGIIGRRETAITFARQDIAVARGKVIVLEREIAAMETHLKASKPAKPKKARVVAVQPDPSKRGFTPK